MSKRMRELAEILDKNEEILFWSDGGEELTSIILTNQRLLVRGFPFGHDWINRIQCLIHTGLV